MALSYRQKATVVALGVYWPAFFILAHIQVPGFVRRAGVSDKGLHFLAYLILVFLFWFAISPDKKVIWRKFPVWCFFFIVTAYGAVDEVIQGFVGRNCDAMDIVANIAGTITGLILFSFATFWPAALIVAGVVIFGLTNITRVNLAEMLPFANAMFHLLAYPVFTMLWIYYMHLSFLIRPPKIKWLITALAAPAMLLLIVKLFSAILGKSLEPLEVLISAVGIVVIVTLISLAALISNAQSIKEG
ncbi:MAG: VanZ family protein [Phycisphaerales bacterium]|jgi:hypothetical protein